MLRYYDNLEKDYYRENGINQQLDMKKRMEKLDHDTKIFTLPKLQRWAGSGLGLTHWRVNLCYTGAF